MRGLRIMPSAASTDDSQDVSVLASTAYEGGVPYRRQCEEKHDEKHAWHYIVTALASRCVVGPAAKLDMSVCRWHREPSAPTHCKPFPFPPAGALASLLTEGCLMMH
jgi:hypothetical protein